MKLVLRQWRPRTAPSRVRGGRLAPILAQRCIARARPSRPRAWLFWRRLRGPVAHQPASGRSRAGALQLTLALQLRMTLTAAWRIFAQRVTNVSLEGGHGGASAARELRLVRTVVQRRPAPRMALTLAASSAFHRNRMVLPVLGADARLAPRVTAARSITLRQRGERRGNRLQLGTPPALQPPRGSTTLRRAGRIGGARPAAVALRRLRVEAMPGQPGKAPLRLVARTQPTQSWTRDAGSAHAAGGNSRAQHAARPLDLVWRPAPTHTVSPERAWVRTRVQHAPASPTSPAHVATAAMSAPDSAAAHAALARTRAGAYLDGAAMERLTNEVLGRLGDKLRVARERRGL